MDVPPCFPDAYISFSIKYLNTILIAIALNKKEKHIALKVKFLF